MGLIEFFGGFLVGTFTGASGKYFSDKFTDQRRKQEALKKSEKIFNAIYNKMPKLIDEMKDDLEKENFREFILLNKNNIFNGKSFCYYYEEHKDLKNKIDTLENHSYITEITDANVKKYRMSEEFIKLLQK